MARATRGNIAALLLLATAAYLSPAWSTAWLQTPHRATAPAARVKSASLGQMASRPGPRSICTERRALLGGTGMLVPVVASLLFGVGLEATRRFQDDGVLRGLLKKYTNIVVIDSPDGKEVAESYPAAIEAKAQGKVRWFVKDANVFRRVLVQGDRGLSESYMDGLWDTDDLELLVWEFLKLEPVKSELGWMALPLVLSAVVGVLKWKLNPSNKPDEARGNISSHYDISTKLYEQMLGPTMQYSCAYYHTPGMTLDEAQKAKMHLVAKKLQLKPGMKVLDLGCGFGAMAHFLATEYGVHVTGATLSKDQHAFQKERFPHPNVDIRLQDFRYMTGKFDRIYSVGIFEHVGRNNYQTYFDKCHEMLVDDGIMLIHTIGFARRGDWNHNGFMNTYIFPGGELPCTHHFTEAYTDKWNLEDWHSFGVSYAQTLRDWKTKLDNWRGLEEFDGRFRRMWEYYLMCCAAAFQARRTKLWQCVFTKMGSGRPDDCHHIRGIQLSELK